jgi:hypothetical protein
MADIPHWLKSVGSKIEWMHEICMGELHRWFSECRGMEICY